MTTLKAAIKNAIDSAASAREPLVEATNFLEMTIRTSPSLYREVLDPLIRRACYDLICESYRSSRKLLWMSTSRPQAAPNANGEALCRVNRALLMDYRLNNGVRLGDADYSLVRENADFHSKQGNAMLIKARWLELIAGRLSSTEEVVSQVLTEGDLLTFQQKAQSR